MHALGGVWTLSLKSALRLCAPHVRSADSSRRETAENARVWEQRPSGSQATREQGLDLVFGGVLDHFLARETALARPDMPLLDRFFRA